MRLDAYRVGQAPESYKLEVAPRRRSWMDATKRGNAYHCTPMIVANQSGWVLRNPVTFEAVWDGRAEAASTKLFTAKPSDRDVLVGSSHFGHGIVSFAIPYIFRTEPGWGLRIAGLPNEPLPGASPLEGIVETDWSVATATMNWKLLDADRRVRFDAGFPVVFLSLVNYGSAGLFRPCIVGREGFGDVDAYERWSERRQRWRAGDTVGGRVWSGEYRKGFFEDGVERLGDRERSIQVREFESG